MADRSDSGRLSRPSPGLVLIVGPTASGKSALALRLAEALGAEIVSADSRLVYRGMDIATAKPTAAERARVTHHLVDVADPEERYDAARYQREARAALADIAARDRRAIVVGGTGLFVRALLDGLDLANVPTDPETRARIEEQASRDGEAAIRARLAAIDPAAADRVPAGNTRRLVRYLEIATLRGTVTGAQRRDAPIEALRFGLAPSLERLGDAIARRVRAMVAAGVLDETRALLARGIDPRSPSLSAHGYVHWAAHLAGELTLDDAIARTVRDTRAYARRQMTWFRRDATIRWLDPSAGDPLDPILTAVEAAA